MRQKDGLSDYSLTLWYPNIQLIIILPIHIMFHILGYPKLLDKPYIAADPHLMIQLVNIPN